MPVLNNITISGGIQLLASPGGSLTSGTLTYLNNVNSDFTLGSTAFTVEFFSYHTNVTNRNGSVFQAGLSFEIFTNGPTYVKVAAGGTNYFFLGIDDPYNKWIHWAISGTNGTMRLFRNGVLLSSTSYGSISNILDRLWVMQTSDYTFQGNLTNFNWVKGTCLYTSTFTPPSSPIIPNANSKLTLLVQNNTNRLKDSSPANYTPSGSATFSSMTPFPFNA